MCIGSGVQNDPITRKTGLLNFIDQFTFNIALKIFKFYVWKLLLKGRNKSFKSNLAIGFRLPLSGEVKIGTIDDADFHGFRVSDLTPQLPRYLIRPSGTYSSRRRKSDFLLYWRGGAGSIARYQRYRVTGLQGYRIIGLRHLSFKKVKLKFAILRSLRIQ
jgi:hypothetical protein